ncbi:thioesterase family protein [Actinomadura mexicana]|uniref:Predicted thioesterase n=1 Tax=Actinomadura mexicana TaxID=134959 RepID=A0A239DRQ3_9ACTN|nr:hotdog domain-containing protein [Actinomadura mexicana]SNS34244.1 Predicted thioesterase [Actinomadura mexicana]
MELTPGLRAEVEIVVAEADTAVHVGSGDVPVLATPRLLALAEAATVEAVRACLGDGETSVGTRAEVRHRVATPAGGRVTVTAELRDVDGTRLAFAFEAVDEQGRVVGDGRIERAVVGREGFLSRLSR